MTRNIRNVLIILFFSASLGVLNHSSYAQIQARQNTVKADVYVDNYAIGKRTALIRFTFEERTEIAGALDKSDDKAISDAEKKYSFSVKIKSKYNTLQMEHQVKLIIELQDKYHKQLCAKYRISAAEMAFIALEHRLDRRVVKP